MKKLVYILVAVFTMISVNANASDIRIYDVNNNQIYHIQASVGEYITLPNYTPPTKEGHVFSGFFNEEGDISLTIDSEGKSWYKWNSREKYVKLYPRFKAKQYTIEFKDSYDRIIKTIEIEYGKFMSLSYADKKTLTPSKTGCKFLGWYTDKETGKQWFDTDFNLAGVAKANYYFDDLGDGIYILRKDLGKNGSTITLYEHWKKEKYNVVFDANNGKIYENGTYKGTQITLKGLTYGDKYQETHKNFTVKREGRVFVGWFDGINDNYSGNSTDDLGKYLYSYGEPRVNDLGDDDCTKIFYAGWSIEKCSIVLHFNGDGDNYNWYNWGVKTTSDATFVCSKKVEYNKYIKDFILHEKISPKRAGYEFLGWFDSPNEGKGIMVFDANGNLVDSKYVIEKCYCGDLGDNNSAFNLYAHWKKGHATIGTIYTISFKRNGGGTLYTNTNDYYPNLWNKNNSYEETKISDLKISFGEPFFNKFNNKTVIDEQIITTNSYLKRDGYKFIGFFTSKEEDAGDMIFDENLEPTDVAVEKYKTTTYIKDGEERGFPIKKFVVGKWIYDFSDVDDDIDLKITLYAQWKVDTTTDIKEVESTNGKNITRTEDIYTLNGVKVEKITKSGIYIINGKKVVK